MADFTMSEGRIHIDGLKPADVALLKAVASEAADAAVSRALVAMGVDPTKPFEAQADMLFLRSTRQRCEGTTGKAMAAVVVLLLGSSLGLLWIGFKASLRTLVPLVVLLALVTAALARDDGRYAQSPLKDWVRGLKDKNHVPCCDESDGEDVEGWSTDGGVYRVKIKGEWIAVPDSAILAVPNRLGYARAWIYYIDGRVKIRCFLPGAGG